MADAVAVQSDSHTLEDKVDASLRNLRLRDWGDDADDALSVFEFLCSARGHGPYQLGDQCAALRERHISTPALMLRYVHAWWLGQNGKVDEALAALDDILDDIDGADGVTEFERNSMWHLWLATIPAATRPPRKRAGNAKVGWELAIALHRSDIQPEQFDTIMAAFTEDTQSAVAAIVAIATPGLGVEMPAEHDPRRYVDETLLAPVDRFIAEQAKRSAAESDS